MFFHCKYSNIVINLVMAKRRIKDKESIKKKNSLQMSLKYFKINSSCKLRSRIEYPPSTFVIAR